MQFSWYYFFGYFRVVEEQDRKFLICYTLYMEVLNMEQSNKKVITDEEVIKMLYQSKALENYNKSGIRLYHGKISEIIVEKNDDVFNINYDFKKFNKMGLYFKGKVVFSENEINQIKTEIEPYKDSIIAVCDFDSKRKYSEEYHLKCFLKEFINMEEQNRYFRRIMRNIWFD